MYYQRFYFFAGLSVLVHFSHLHPPCLFVPMFMKTKYIRSRLENNDSKTDRAQLSKGVWINGQVCQPIRTATHCHFVFNLESTYPHIPKNLFTYISCVVFCCEPVCHDLFFVAWHHDTVVELLRSSTFKSVFLTESWIRSQIMTGLLVTSTFLGTMAV